MFPVIFEVLPRKENWDNYLENAKMLRPELEQVDGFIDNIRNKSLTREGWILSLSNWRDEKSLVRWRTRIRHHEVQQKGRDKTLADFCLSGCFSKAQYIVLNLGWTASADPPHRVSAYMTWACVRFRGRARFGTRP